MGDRLTIRGLTVRCRLGVPEEERRTPQEVHLDLSLIIDADGAARRDDVRDAVDYAALVAAVKQLAQEQPHHLMETLAEEVAALVLRRFATPEVSVTVTKRALPGIESASVEVTRRKD